MTNDIMNSLYHNCRSCHWFSKGKCLHGNTFCSSIDIEKLIYSLSDAGILGDAIIEGFKDSDFSKLKDNLDKSNLSKKKAKEIMDDFFNELEAVQRHDWSVSIETAIIKAIVNSAAADEESADPDDPDNFYCKYFE